MFQIIVYPWQYIDRCIFTVYAVNQIVICKTLSLCAAEHLIKKIIEKKLSITIDVFHSLHAEQF